MAALVWVLHPCVLGLEFALVLGEVQCRWLMFRTAHAVWPLHLLWDTFKEDSLFQAKQLWL
jgi:hypothetical protein